MTRCIVATRIYGNVPVTEDFAQEKQFFYGAIHASNNAGEPTIFIEFMLSTIKTALLEATGQKEKPLGKNAQNAAYRRQFTARR